MSFVSDFEPKVVWQHFDKILTIPRGSKEEEEIREYVCGVADKAGLSYTVDDAGNVVVMKPGTTGHENAQTTIMQAHIDMVNEKNSDVEHDFSSDPIEPVQDGDYLRAAGTTLGSDNGIGVAAMLAVMEADDLVHGPLEFLFTIDEETGMTGALELSADVLTGRQLLNLDTEEEGSLYVGCAGGKDSSLSLPLHMDEVPADSAGLRIELKGMKGGHSGVDVHLQRGNATKLLIRALGAQYARTPFRMADIEGGNKHNAIPREAFSTIVVPAADKDAFVAGLEGELGAIQDEFRPAEPDMTFDISDIEAPASAWDPGTTETVIRLITGLPHGVVSMSYDIPDLVETSTNLATVKADSGTLSIGMSSRSSVDSALLALVRRVRDIGELAGATVEEGNGYPGWKPDMDSRLLGVMKEIHERVLGTEPEVKAVHAGLECGIIGEKIPGMDMISFGPQIEFPHSPDERVKIGTVDDFYRLLVVTLEEIA
jgi:dipeptidase D